MKSSTSVSVCPTTGSIQKADAMFLLCCEHLLPGQLSTSTLRPRNPGVWTPSLPVGLLQSPRHGLTICARMPAPVKARAQSKRPPAVLQLPATPTRHSCLYKHLLALAHLLHCCQSAKSGDGRNPVLSDLTSGH